MSRHPLPALYFGTTLITSTASAISGCPSVHPVEPDAFIPNDAGSIEDDAFVMEHDVFIRPGADAALDAFRGPDAARQPDATFGPPTDAGPCGDDAGLSRCECLTLGPDCSSASCPAGLVCVPDGCGMHCQASGDVCSTSTDCPDGAACVSTPLGMICARSSPSCETSRDCPVGFSCDTSACVDRRIGCTTSDFEDTCPFNFVCNNGLGAAFCERAMPRCETDAQCNVVSRCVDVEGDGARECVFPGLCDALSDCAPATMGSCGTEPSRLVADCIDAGLCRTSADCFGARTCVDLWGDGQTECVLAGGTCTSQADCAAGTLCGSPYEGGAPRCLDVALTID